ncbi:MAG TPA: hypothetical protein VD907_03610 [Verrucomicrobiae bacterium]|nr:hypothetical protein [Verrucomicrobiae bacterium]
MLKPRSIAKIIADTEGNTSFKDITLDTSQLNFAPPAPVLRSTEVLAATGIRFLVLPEGWSGDFHPAPSRILGIVVEGELEEATTDGETRLFKPGEMILGEDMGSKGHTTVAIKKTTLAIIHLAEDE